MKDEDEKYFYDLLLVIGLIGAVLPSIGFMVLAIAMAVKLIVMAVQERKAKRLS